jgi:periplasmic divalent cation tolerance protein
VEATNVTNEHIVVFCTVPDPGKGAEIARHLVDEKLCACVNIVPGLRSIYWWKGAVCDDPEALMVIKSRAERFEALRRRIVSLHPYETAEVVALPIVAGHAPYLAWIDAAVTRED